MYHIIPLLTGLVKCLHLCLQEKNVPNSEDLVSKTQKNVVVKYCNIIDASFWEAHPEILN